MTEQTATIGEIVTTFVGKSPAEVEGYAKLRELATKNESPIVACHIYTIDGTTMGVGTLATRLGPDNIYVATARYLEGAWVLTDSQCFTSLIIEALAAL